MLQLRGGSAGAAQNGPMDGVNGAGPWKISNWVKGSKAEHLEESSRLSVASAGSNAGSAPTSAQQSPARNSKGLNLLDDVSVKQ